MNHEKDELESKFTPLYEKDRLESKFTSVYEKDGLESKFTLVYEKDGLESKFTSVYEKMHTKFRNVFPLEGWRHLGSLLFMEIKPTRGVGGGGQYCFTMLV